MKKYREVFAIAPIISFYFILRIEFSVNLYYSTYYGEAEADRITSSIGFWVIDVLVSLAVSFVALFAITWWLERRSK